jgi:hypothetical protein
MLEEETTKMQHKLETVKNMMELEKQKRADMTKTKEGNMWRSSTTKKPIAGYSKKVLENHKKVQPNLPPTSLILGQEGKEQAPKGKPLMGGVKRPPSN